MTHTYAARILSALTFVVATLLASPSHADEWCVDKEVAITVRDKARAYEALCREVSALPEGVRVLCEDASTSAEWVAKAERLDDVQAALAKTEAELNGCRGRVNECRSQVVPLQRRVESLAGEKHRADRLAKRWPRWVSVAGVVVGVVGGGALTYGVSRMLE